MKQCFGKRRRLCSCLLVLACLCLLPSCMENSPGVSESTGFVMGSLWSQKLIGGEEGRREEVQQKVAESLSQLEKKISWRVSDSEIDLLNQKAGIDSVELSEDTYSLLKLSLQIAEDSGSAYQPLILPLSRLWNFDGEEFILPGAEELEAGKKIVAESVLILDDNKKRAALTPSGGGVELGALGKGAACDLALSVMEESGLSGGMISVGGSIGVFGKNDRGDTGWKIGVRDPYGSQSDVLGVITLKDQFVSTSGTYEKTRKVDGREYHHILDPATGWPAETELVSVTVVCGGGAESDGLATACVILGQEKGEALLRGYGAEGIFIHKNKDIYVTEGLRENFVLQNNHYRLVNP